ncbi:hypothetical protein EWI61_13655 [Methylolobus aquaticus]|nr:hypothetical protein EWI61_13655 [Methylolobus aquaticus]
MRALDARVALAWLEFDGRKNTVHLRASNDGGTTWGPDRILAETAGEADYPLLISDGQSLFVSWNARSDGYRLLRLP